MSFAPSSTDGGVINIGSSVGIGNANFNGQSSASGPSTNMGLNLNLGAPAQPTLMLQNLHNFNNGLDTHYQALGSGLDHKLQNLKVIVKINLRNEEANYIDGLRVKSTNNQGFGNSKKPTVVTNFTHGDQVYNFTVPPGEQRWFWGSRDINDKAKQQIIMDQFSNNNLINLYNTKYVTELKDKLIVDGVTQGIYNQRFGDDDKEVEVRNFRD